MTPTTAAGRALLAQANLMHKRWPATDGLIGKHDIRAIETEAVASQRERLEALPRLWWCSGWGTLNEKRHHGNETACAGESCGNVAYVRDTDLRAALRSTPAAPDLRGDEPYNTAGGHDDWNI